MVSNVMFTVIEMFVVCYVKNSLVTGYIVICEKYIVIFTVGSLCFVMNIQFYEYAILLS